MISTLSFLSVAFVGCGRADKIGEQGEKVDRIGGEDEMMK
jgi:hypothetical protein